MSFYDIFWNDELWFLNISDGQSIKWETFMQQDGSEEYFPVAYDLIWSIPFGIILVWLRRILQSGILTKFGYYMGVPRQRSVKVAECVVLEQAYRNGHHNDKSSFKRFTKQTDMSLRHIEIWFRKRAKQDIPTDIKRFVDISWNFLIRGSSFLIGFFSLLYKPWFWDTKYAWLDWPHHHVSNDMYCFFMLELSKYWHLTVILLTERKKPDFWVSVTHHFCTIVLMYFCWVLNFVRIGTLILLAHDTSDPWMDITKILVYCKKKRLSEIFFVIFVFLWMVTKDGIYPFRLLYSTTFEAPLYLPVTNHMIVFFNVFLYVLMVVQVIWTYSIFEVIINKMRKGDLKDVRSDSEKEDDVEEMNTEEQSITETVCYQK